MKDYRVTYCTDRNGEISIMDLYSAEVVEYIKDIQSIYTKTNEGKIAEKDFISHLHSIGIPSNEIENKINDLNKKKLSSIYPNSIDMLTIEELSKLLEDAKEVFGFSVSVPPIAMVSMFSFSARIMLPDTNRSEIIFISSGLFNFLFSIGKIMVQALEITKEKECTKVSFDKVKIRRNIQDKQLQRDFIKIITVYFYSNTCIYTGIENLTYEQAEVLGILVKTMRCFVIAHEYSHLLLGHTKRERPIDKGNISFKIIEQNWEDEKSADQLGHMLTNIAMYNCGIEQPYSLWGGYLFIKILEIFENFEKKIKNKQALSVTHPPAAERKVVYYDSILEESIDNMKNYVIPIFDFVFDLFQNDIEPILDRKSVV